MSWSRRREPHDTSSSRPGVVLFRTHIATIVCLSLHDLEGLAVELQ